MYDFLGKWQIHRTITQRHNAVPQVIKVEGEAIFKEVDPRPNALLSPLFLDYSEQVQVYLPTAVINARQRYQYQLSASQIDVYFAHGGLFHTVNFLDSESEFCVVKASPHLCGQDRYETRYFFRNSEEFDLVYEVLGPSKNYESYTQFRRCLTHDF